MGTIVFAILSTIIAILCIELLFDRYYTPDKHPRLRLVTGLLSKRYHSIFDKLHAKLSILAHRYSVQAVLPDYHWQAKTDHLDKSNMTELEHRPDTPEVLEKVEEMSNNSLVVNPNQSLTTDDANSRLFAFVIGIDNYASEDIRDLSGGVADAQDVEVYLREKFGIPQGHIRKLCNSEATREAIIAGFSDLREDPRIKTDDPILIYFAGHGSEEDAPKAWGAQGGKIQLIVPQDTRTMTDGKIVNAIADRTMSALLEDLAKAKGNNITVVLDCCYSHSGTRAGDSSPRATKLKGSLPSDLDSDILPPRSRHRDPIVDRIFRHHGLRSHVLLAACGAGESAQEKNRRGEFTKALIGTLRKFDESKMTYRDLMTLLPKLHSYDSQNPHCEGHYKDRFLFSVNAADDSSILVEKDGPTLWAGEAHGITSGSQFDVYAHRNQSMGSLLGRFCVAQDIEPIRATLEPVNNTKPELPRLSYARLVSYAFPKELRLRVSFSKRFGEDFVKEILAAANAGLSTCHGNERFHCTEEETAVLVVDIHGENDNRRAVFQVRVQYAQDNGLERLALDESVDSAGGISRVLRLVGHWNWHLKRQGPGEFRDGVSIGFYRLEEVDDTYYGRIWKPVEPIQNIVDKEGIMDITVNPEHHFGMKITNETDYDLYPYLFYFGVMSQNILDYELGSAGKDAVDVPLSHRSHLVVGYGATGGEPFTFEFPRNAGTKDRPGFFKLFLTTSPTSSASFLQVSPFKTSRDPDRIEVPRWDTVTVKIIERLPA